MAQTKRKKKNAGGRPSVMTKEVLEKLEWAFTIDATVEQACEYAGICPKTVYNYDAANPGFLQKIKGWQGRLGLRAKAVVATGIEQGDKNMAKWYLEKRDEDYKNQQKIELSGQVNNPFEGITTQDLLALRSELVGGHNNSTQTD